MADVKVENKNNNNSKITNLNPHSSVPTIISNSKVMTDVLELVDKVSKTENTTVLITGESGTGKELIARAIHNNSSRRDNPFIAINCGAITETLIESELFGHEKGAFTGAIGQKKGKFEQANGGTLFLDEVGELSPSAQVQLLRVLQAHEFQRVGGSEIVRVDVRLLTATNRNLEEDIKAGRFRNDLYHRIKVFTIHMPSLRKRKEDIPLLIEYFVDMFNTKLGRTISIPGKVVNVLVDYSWPGNVRELLNTMETMMIKASGNTISIDNIPQNIFQNSNLEKETVPAFNQEAQNYRNLVEWILKEENYLKGKQCEKQLKTQAKQLDIWPTKQGIAGIGRSLIKVLNTNTEFFQDIDKEGIKNIFDLLFLLAPSFKTEKAKSVERLLSKWPNEKVEKLPAEEFISMDNKIPETFITQPESLNKAKDHLPPTPITAQDKKPTKEGLSDKDIEALIKIVIMVLVLIYFILMFFWPETWLVPIIRRINFLVNIFSSRY